MTAARGFGFERTEEIRKCVDIFREYAYWNDQSAKLLQNCGKWGIVPDSEHIVYIDSMNLQGCTNLESFVCGGQTDQIDLSGFKKN